MNNDPLAPVNSGTPLLEAVTAARLNALSGAAKLVRDNRRGADAGKNSGRAPDSITLLVRNDTATAFPINTAVQIGDPIGPPVSGSEYWQRGRVYGGILPTAAGVIYGITEEPILADGVGRVVVAGIVPVTLTISGLLHDYADSTASSGELLTAYHGTARILWKESSTGSGKRGVVQLFPRNTDAAAGVPGLITIFDQVLGAGVKTADGFRVTNGVITNIISSSQMTFDSTVSGVDTDTEFVGGDKLNSRLHHFATDGNAVFDFNADNFTIGSVPMVTGTDGIGNSFIKGFCVAVGGGGGGSGTVTSIDLTVPSWLVVSGNPITTSGTLIVGAATGQTANKILATPDGSTGAVALRSLAIADLPALTTANVTDSTNKRYVTDAQLVVLSNTSGTNTGDQTNIAGNAATVTTNANLTGPVTSVGNATTITDNSITTAKIADANVTSAKLADGAVTVAKLGTGIPTQSLSLAIASFRG